MGNLTLDNNIIAIVYESGYLIQKHDNMGIVYEPITLSIIDTIKPRASNKKLCLTDIDYLAISPDSKLLYFILYNKTFEVFRQNDNTDLWSWKNIISISKNGRFLLIRTTRNTGKIYDIKSHRQTFEFKLDIFHTLKSISLSDCGNYILINFEFKFETYNFPEFTSWMLIKSQERQIAPVFNDYTWRKQTHFNRFYSDENRIIFCTENSLKICNFNGRELYELENSHKRKIEHLDFGTITHINDDRSIIITASDDGDICLHEFSTRQEIACFTFDTPIIHLYLYQQYIIFIDMNGKMVLSKITIPENFQLENRKNDLVSEGIDLSKNFSSFRFKYLPFSDFKHLPYFLGPIFNGKLHIEIFYNDSIIIDRFFDININTETSATLRVPLLTLPLFPWNLPLIGRFTFLDDTDSQANTIYFQIECACSDPRIYLKYRYLYNKLLSLSEDMSSIFPVIERTTNVVQTFAEEMSQIQKSDYDYKTNSKFSSINQVRSFSYREFQLIKNIQINFLYKTHIDVLESKKNLLNYCSSSEYRNQDDILFEYESALAQEEIQKYETEQYFIKFSKNLFFKTSKNEISNPETSMALESIPDSLFNYITDLNQREISHLSVIQKNYIASIFIFICALIPFPLYFTLAYLFNKTYIFNSQLLIFNKLPFDNFINFQTNLLLVFLPIILCFPIFYGEYIQDLLKFRFFKTSDLKKSYGRRLYDIIFYSYSFSILASIPFIKIVFWIYIFYNISDKIITHPYTPTYRLVIIEKWTKYIIAFFLVASFYCIQMILFSHLGSSMPHILHTAFGSFLALVFFDHKAGFKKSIYKPNIIGPLVGLASSFLIYYRFNIPQHLTIRSQYGVISILVILLCFASSFMIIRFLYKLFLSKIYNYLKIEQYI